jgi:O-antigen/teichoic acid export membrane protein
LAQVGMSESLFFFLPGATRDGGRYVANTMIVLGGVGLLVAAAFWGGAERLAAWMNNPDLAPLMPLLAVFFLLMLVSYVLEIVMTARQEYRRAAVSYGLSDLARGLLIVAPVLVLQTLASLLYGAILFAAIRLGTTLWYCWRQFGASLRPEWRLLTKQIVYSVPFAFYVLFTTGQETLHQYVVSSLFDAATFAVYSVGCLQVPLVELVSTSVVNVMMVGMVQTIRDGRESAVLSMWHDTVRKLALIFFPLVALLLITAHDLIVFLFTDQYAASVPIFRAWALAILLAVIPMDGLLRVYAQTPFLLVINIARLAIVAGGMYWFVTSMGLVGAVLVTLVALAVGKAMGLMKMMRCWRIGGEGVLPWRDLLAIGAVTALASLPTLWVASQLAAPPFARLAVLSAIYGTIYGATAWMSGLLRKSEQDTLLRWVQPLRLSRFRFREL